MRKNLVESYVDKLCASFGPVRTPVVEEKLRILYDAKDYEQMICHIRSILNLDMRVLLGLVNKGGPNAPAWITMPNHMPILGTSAFRALTVTMYLRKSFLAEGSFEEVVIAIAHEFSHVVLSAVGHSLREQEEAVDLTAMLLGFRDFYLTGCRSVREQKQSSGDFRTYEIKNAGYLTFEEVSHAVTYMTFR